MDFDFSPLQENWRFLADGFGVTVVLSIASAVSSIALGLAIALLRLYGPRWFARLLIFYVDTMRAIPLLVVLVWIYFAFPLLAKVSFPPFWAALVALTLHIAAYASELIRAGIESVRPGQTWAGLALGLTRMQVVRKVVLPQATIRMLPAFGSILTVAIKDTAVASIIAVPELLHKSEAVAGQSYRNVEVYTTLMILYFMLSFPVTRAVDGLYRRLVHRGRS